MKIHYLHAIVTLACIGIFFTFFDNKEEQISFEKGKYLAVKFDDTDENGNTKADVSISDNSFCYEYTLKKGYESPYAGVIVKPTIGYFNLEQKNLITFSINSPVKKRIFIMIGVHNTKGKDMRFRKGINVKKGIHTYEINQHDLKVPEWFYKSRKIMENDVKLVDFSQVQTISFESNLFTQVNEFDKICINKLTLKRNNHPISIGTAIAILFLNSLILPFYKKKIKLTYQAASTDNLTQEQIDDQETKKLLEYLNRNYTNPDLSIKLIKKETKIHENKIPQLIKKKFHLSYKQYINQLRIEEAKRLLHHDGRTISEIGFLVGFNSIVTFNRVFKTTTGITPTEFLKLNK